MKLAPLLAEFLYTQKRLDLPGIGSFLFDSNTEADIEGIKAGKIVMTEGLTFQANPGLQADPGLISFIASSTGKIKALAAADLDSQLETARQFLNIGKPYLFEGIGSLTKLQSGQYDFQPGTPVIEKANTRTSRTENEVESADATSGGFKSIFYTPKVKPNYRKTLFIFLLVAGLGLALWGGYIVYKKTTRKKEDTVSNEKIPNDNITNLNQEKSPADTVVAKNENNSINEPPTPLAAAPGSYKFVVETAGKERAIKRYGLLKGFGLNINMETSDSVSFKLFFLLPAAPADTARLVDSLRRLYTPPGNKAYIEK